MIVLLFVAILVALILVHEFGHFIVAKALKVRVDEFGVGLPPRALTLFKKGDTAYTLNWLPIGGFVRLYGEETGDPVESADKDRAFVSRPPLTQASILVAGVAFNVLAAWLIYISLFATGIPMAVEEAMIHRAKDVKVTVTAILPDSPAAGTDFSLGDEIISVSDGAGRRAVSNAEDVSAFIGTREPSEILVEVRRGEEIEQISLESVKGLIEEDPERSAVGIAVSRVGIVSFPIQEAFTRGTKLTFSNLWAIVVAVGGLVVGALTFSADLSQIAGPVGIVGLVGDAASLGVVPVLLFAAFISLNLAIINIIPFPALDGGRLLFVAIEAVKGSPMPPAMTRMANAIGFGLLILLLLTVTYNDILRLLS